jgi:hypothetical protein
MAVGEIGIAEESRVAGVSPWLLLLRDELGRLGEPLVRAGGDVWAVEVRHSGGSLWVLGTLPTGARVAFCAAYAPGGSTLVEESRDDSSLTVRLETVFSAMMGRVELPSASGRVQHWKTTLRPSRDLTLPYWPRDVLSVDDAVRPVEYAGRRPRGAEGP